MPFPQATRAAVAVLLACAACGGRTPLESSVSNSGSTPTGGASGPCSAWQVNGPRYEPRLLSSIRTSPGGTVGLGAPVAIDPGLLVGWYESPDQTSQPQLWSTRTLAFDGAPRGDIQVHPGLTVQTAAWNGSFLTSLAANRTSVGALVGVTANAAGCRFLPLDANGAELGPIVPQAGSACSGLGADGDGFSFLSASMPDVTPVVLHRVDARGVTRSATTLAIPPNRFGWDRVLLGDGSFLVSTYDIVGTLTTATNWVQGFDASGAPLAQEHALGASAGRARVVATSTGALVGLEGPPIGLEGTDIHLVALDREGAPAGPEQLLMRKPLTDSLRLFGTPSGDVLVFWYEYGTDSLASLFVQAVAPDGRPRAAATVLFSNRLGWARDFYVVVDASGERAVYIEAADGGAYAMALGCIR